MAASRVTLLVSDVAMLDAAIDGADVRAVIADTPAEPGPSTRVLEKTGFVYDGEVSDEERQPRVAVAPGQAPSLRRHSEAARQYS